jgi:hypothetical protein
MLVIHISKAVLVEDLLEAEWVMLKLLNLEQTLLVLLVV